ncbi:eukaryotic translation initiation factor 4E transporter isoform X9 [Schistocerca gregaria]|uniref:eukaryotic translation initiation factor 4E transporter isoform X9 n=1 Tax=Schistocerca gregaria TaxID=7010 RepID=UPI00211E0D84|nr:eukaryotic translation initiation factor 4E transporter isoform X9 [Schistocerca gregaria]
MASVVVMTMPLGTGIGATGGGSGAGSIRRARPRSRPRPRQQRGTIAAAFSDTGPTGIPEKDEQLQQQQPRRRRRRRRRARTSSPQSPNATMGAAGLPTNQKGYRRRARTRPQRLRRVTFSDDIMTMSYSESDTTVEVVTSSRKGSLPQLQYSREQLIEFSRSPLAKVRPECLDPAFNNARGVWDPVLWHLERKRSETPPDDRGIRGDPADTQKRRSGDPRERIRKEQDGIILSPQRRSFNSGCYVAPAQQTLGRRSESPTNKSERERDPSHREVQSRRIGSGRIVTRDVWDFRLDKEQDQSSSEFGFQRNSTSRDERFDRRPFGRDFDRDKDKSRGERNRYNDKRRAYSDSKEEEPEWFSGGPTSQNDKIDLGGFGDFCDDGNLGRPTRKSASQKSGKSNRSSGRKLSEPSPPVSAGQSSASSRRTPTPPGNRSGAVAQPQPTQSHSPIAEETPRSPERPLPEKGPLSPDLPSDQDSGLPAEQLPQSNNSSFSHQHQGLDFNLDDFLKSDSVPGLLANGAVNDSSGGSRFSQWFRRESPVNRQAENITEPAIVIPPLSESDTYFTPISPAESTVTQQNLNVSTDSDNTQKSSLLEMLQRRPQGDTSASAKTSNIRELEVTGKIHSVEELEAKIRQGINSTESQNATVNSNTKKEEDLSAFNKLLAQITDGKVIPATAPNGPLPSNIQQLHFTQMLKNSQQNRQVSRQTSIPDHSVNMVGGLENTNSQNKQTTNISQQQQQMQIPKDLVMKLLQVQQQQRQQQQQQEMLSKLIAANQHVQLAQQRQQQQQAVPSHMGHFTVPPPVHPVLPAVPPSLSPLPPELQVMVNNAQPSHELLQRPEAKAILQGLRYGEITSHHLVQQLQNPAMQHRHREVLLSILKMQMQQGIVHRTASPHLHAGQAPELLHQMMLQQQQQQHQQQQIRIPSPLNNAYCQGSSLISPSMTVKANTLTVQPPVVPRVPSPRELQLHTQNIMQSALIKKKLEEQRENYRKRQEMQQSLSPNVSSLSNAGGNSVKTGDSAPPKLISPTPLAFTPTSVLRKMTAEKDPENSATSNRSEAKSAEQQKMLQQQLPINPPTSQQQSSISQTRSQLQQAVPTTWNVNLPKQQQGRPIVKGNGNFHYGSSIDYQQQQIHQQRHNVVLQGSGSYGSNVGATRSKLVTHPQNVAAAVATQQLNSLMMMQRPPPPVTQNHPGARAQTLQAQLVGYQQSQQQQRNISPAVQQILPNQNYNTGRNTSKPGTVAESRLAGGLQRPSQQQPQQQVQQLVTRNSAIPQQNRSTSPTSNQLARWFSPELLAQARAGQLPNMPPVPSTPNVLSLEELERLQQSAAAAAVHN